MGFIDLIAPIKPLCEAFFCSRAKKLHTAKDTFLCCAARAVVFGVPREDKNTVRPSFYSHATVPKRLQSFLDESPARRRFEIPLEGDCPALIRKREVSLDAPRFPLCCVPHFALVMTLQSFSKVNGGSCIKAIWIDFALQDINVDEVSHLAGLPSRSSPQDRGKAKICPPSLKLRRDSLRSPLRSERRLEARGVEPLSSSLSAQTSTCLSGDKF